ncbi:glyoxalase [Saccharomonospora viridis]|nr:glyoxalase [Saccharomonospora viridis]
MLIVVDVMDLHAMSDEAPRYLGLAPYLYYTDATEAVEWLTRVFGFREKVRYVDAAGEVFQATLLAGDAEIQVTAVDSTYWEAKGVDGPVGQLNVVYVDDVDAQYERVRAAVGESVELTTPQDQPYGARLFTVQDVGGNSWTFWQHISDVVDLPVGWQEIRAEDGQNAVTRKNIEQSEREHELG